MTGPVHRTITGPIAALEPALAEHVRTAKRDDPLTPVVILAGETLLRPYLRRRLVELTGPLVNVHVLTAGELGLVLGEHRLIAQGRTPLPILADGVLAHEAALTTTGYFDAVRNTPGFANALHRTLSDLQRAAITPQELREQADGLEESDKVRALAALAERLARLRGEHYDADQALAVADPDRLAADELIVYGLWEAPEILRGAIAAIARHAARSPSTCPRPIRPPTPRTPTCANGWPASWEHARRPWPRHRDHRKPPSLTSSATWAPANRPPTRAPTPPCESSPPPTPRGRCGRPCAPACSGRARASACTRWRSPTATPSPTGRCSPQSRERQSSPSTTTRARRWPSCPSAGAHWHCSTCWRTTSTGHR